MTFGSLFAGIGGMDLGLERAGMECRWQVEIDPYARRVLERHWPSVRRHDDVRTFPPDDSDDWRVDLIAGGFPCQDISQANHRGLGLDGERSGLWTEFARVLRVVRPRFAVVENVPRLLARGFGRVLGDLATLGFDAEWMVLPAASLGAAHGRYRLFILAHALDLDVYRHEVYCGASHKAASTESTGRLPEGCRIGVIDGQSNRRVRRVPDPGVCRVADGVPGRLD